MRGGSLFKKNSPDGEFLISGRLFFLGRGTLYECIQAGFLASSGIAFDDFLLSSFVESLDSLLQLLLSFINVSSRDSLAGLLDGAFDNTIHDFVAERVLGGDAHVFDGRLLDWHICTSFERLAVSF